MISARSYIDLKSLHFLSCLVQHYDQIVEPGHAPLGNEILEGWPCGT